VPAIVAIMIMVAAVVMAMVMVVMMMVMIPIAIVIPVMTIPVVIVTVVAALADIAGSVDVPAEEIFLRKDLVTALVVDGDTLTSSSGVQHGEPQC